MNSRYAIYISMGPHEEYRQLYQSIDVQAYANLS